MRVKNGASLPSITYPLPEPLPLYLCAAVLLATVTVRVFTDPVYVA